ncbi:hypothetical protein [Burkholderia sp. BE17]|uniref:hypothetical protein n=1 Tax=Burkholderia sp. BE17 TaxID=2656644 RepID=UPI00128C2857|nr:hypothetical protein [Burkholderia sp. BE17]MPV64339.1 hypothetical protein [Burkholderia sp. BE17]
MSFDIVILKPTESDVNGLTSVHDVSPIGTLETVLRECDSVFPGATGGVHLKGENFALEFSTAGDPVTSVHVALRFGTAWSDETYALFIEHLTRLCRNLGSVAFAVSDNSRLAP